MLDREKLKTLSARIWSSHKNVLTGASSILPRLSALVLIAGAMIGIASGQVRYRVTDLGSLGLGGTTTAIAINNQGEVLGLSSCPGPTPTPLPSPQAGTGAIVASALPGPTEPPSPTPTPTPVGVAGKDAFLHTAAQMIDLNSIGGQRFCGGAAFALNNNGDAIIANNGAYALFTAADGKVTAFSDLPGWPGASARSIPIAINDAREVTGTEQLSEFSPTEAILFSNGKVSVLPNPVPGSMFSSAINNHGEVTGFFVENGVAFALDAFLFSNGQSVELAGGFNGQNDSETIPAAINDKGEIAGRECPQLGFFLCGTAFLFHDGSIQDLGTFGGTSSRALGINNSSQVVGAATIAGSLPRDQLERAFIFTHGPLVNLNDVIPASLGITLQEAVSINDSGQIAANATNGHAFVLSLVARAWKRGPRYRRGQEDSFLGNVYRCLRSHTSNSSLKPTLAPKLWELVF